MFAISTALVEIDTYGLEDLPLCVYAILKSCGDLQAVWMNTYSRRKCDGNSLRDSGMKDAAVRIVGI